MRTENRYILKKKKYIKANPKPNRKRKLCYNGRQEMLHTLNYTPPDL